MEITPGYEGFLRFAAAVGLDLEEFQRLIAHTVLGDQIESLGRIRYAFPTHYSGDWVWIFTSGEWSADLWRGALLTLGYVVVFVGFAAWWFRRKDILS